MALEIADRVKETTTTTSTGTYALAGAVDGFQSFAAVGDGNTTYYACTDGTDYEVGIGSYTASGTTLSRVTILESSNSDAAVNWGAGTKEIFVTVPAEKYLVRDASGNVSLTGNLTISGTVDGRDVSADGSKLDGIESGATADQTAAQIRAKVEAASDSNVFTDADHTKLNGIEANAKDDQTITAGSGLTGGGTGDVTLSHADTSSQASVNGSGRTYIQDITLDTYGHVTGLATATETVVNTDTVPNNATITISAGNALTGGGNFTTDQASNETITINHQDTSSQASVNNSGRTYIQDITLDSYGHVTGISSATETVTNTNTNQLTTFQVEDGDGTEVTIRHGKEWKFVEGGGIDINWTDTSPGSDSDPYDLTFTHADTSSQGSVNNSNGTVIQDVTLDGYGHVTALGSVNLDNRYTLKDHIRSIGTPAFTGGTNPNITTAQLVTEMENDGSFDSYSSVFKTSWSYAGNYNLSDAGGFTETAGTSWLTWTDNSSDSTRGNITALAIAPNTGGSAGGVFIYNDQGSSYSPGWREVWTSMTDGSGSGLDADLLDGQHGSYYYPASNPNGYTTNVGDITGVTAGSGLTGGGTSGAVTVSHSDTSSQASVNNSGNTVIQDVTLDTYGHVTGLTSKALSIPAAANNATITLSAGTGLSGGGNFTTNQSSNETITFNLEAPYTYIDTATGNYGTVKVDDDRGVSWAGYAIRDDWVFMSDGANNAGLYNDTDNEWAWLARRNAEVEFYYNGSLKFETSSNGIEMSGRIDMNNNDIYGCDQFFHHGDTNTYMQFHASDQWRVVVGGTERLEVKNSSPHVLVTGDLNSTSDARLKENVEPIANALSDITQLEGVSFDWKDTGTRGHGFIAHQVEPILPDVVQTDDETGIKSINYVGMIGHLVEAIKEQQTQIDDLTAQVKELNR